MSGREEVGSLGSVGEKGEEGEGSGLWEAVAGGCRFKGITQLKNIMNLLGFI